MSGKIGINTTTPDEILRINGSSNGDSRLRLFNQGVELGALGSYLGYIGSGNANDLLLITPNNLAFGASGSEQMRLTSTGLGIGTSSPATKLDKLKEVLRKMIREEYKKRMVNKG